MIDGKTVPYKREKVVLANQVKSLDWKVRKAVKKGTAPLNVVEEPLSKLGRSSKKTIRNAKPVIAR